MFFYSNEHEPIHIHVRYNGMESKAEFFILNGKIVEIKITHVKEYKPITGKKLKDFKDFLNKYSDEIVQKWIDYFVLHKEIKFKKLR